METRRTGTETTQRATETWLRLTVACGLGEDFSDVPVCVVVGVDGCVDVVSTVGAGVAEVGGGCVDGVVGVVAGGWGAPPGGMGCRATTVSKVGSRNCMGPPAPAELDPLWTPGRLERP